MKVRQNKASLCLLSLFALAIFIVFDLFIVFLHVDVLPDGPGRRMYEVAESIIHRGSLVPDYFIQLESFLRDETKRSSGAMWQDVFSLTREGRVFPKHSLLSSLLLVPFVALFGVWGVLVSTTVVQTGTVVATHYISSLLQPGVSWITSLVSILIGTQILYYSGGVAYDALGGFLIVAGVAIAKKNPLAAGFLVGAAVFCRPINLMYALILVFFTERRRLGWAMVGVAVPTVLFLTMNHVLWGGPLITAHHRMPEYHLGEPVFSGASVRFDWNVLASEWREKLFSPVCGLLSFNPILVLVPFLGWRLIGDGRRVAIIVVCLLECVAVFSYSGWSESVGGNRYLCPAIWLLASISIGSVDNMLRPRHQREPAPT